MGKRLWTRSARQTVELAIGAAVIAGLAWWLAKDNNLATIIASFQRLSLAQLSITAFLFAVTYLLRATRIYDTFPAEELSFTGCLRVTLVHNAMVNVVPFRGGEASFPILMSGTLGVPMARAVASLVWFRLQDLMAVAVLAIAVVPYLPLAAKVAGIGVVCLAAWAAPTLARHFPPVTGTGRIARLLEKSRVALSEATTRPARGWIWTAGAWLAKLGAEVWLLATLLPSTALVAAMGVLGAETAAVLPVQGVAGFGTYEAGASLLLAPFGVGLEAALNGALALHVMVISFALLAALVSLALPLPVAKATVASEGARK